ncbi:MAG: HAMP domain-containing sensor histidine kinase [Acidobacteriaceae bacterium]
MRIVNRRKAIITFITLGSLLVGIAAALNVGWIILNWRESVLVVLGIVLFAIIIAGLILNTTFLVREIRRNEQQDSFLNTVTHELKTPIASIRLYLETLQRRAVDPAKAREFYALMLADTDRLMGTVDQVLKAGALGQKGMLQNALEVDLNQLVQQCTELVRSRYGLPGESLTLHSPNENVIVLGNPEELRSALTNVLDNAVKYSPAESAHVEVVVRELGPEAEIVVSDNGRGIPAGELKQVFKRFYRVHEPGQKVKGTGLGLFIVQAIMRKHGGSVTAESPGVGKGATIRLRLPKVYAT